MTIGWQEVYLYAKVIGAIGSALTALYGVYSYLKAVYKQRKSIDETVTLLATNHLPHLQTALDEHGKLLIQLTSDVRDVSTKVDGVESRLEDTKVGMHTLGESFLRHLESTSKEKIRKR
jgi:hypothetical protein